MDLSKYNILLKYKQNKVNTFNCIQHMFIFVCVSGEGWWLLLTFAATLTFNIFKRLLFFFQNVFVLQNIILYYIYIIGIKLMSIFKIRLVDKYVLFLMSNVPNRGSYINAINVPVSFENFRICQFMNYLFFESKRIMVVHIISSYM